MPKATTSAPSKASSDSQSVPAVTYDAAMSELESLVQRMETGDMPLEELLTAYQRGAALVEVCRSRLKAVEDQIKVLDDGVLKTWKGA